MTPHHDKPETDSEGLVESPSEHLEGVPTSSTSQGSYSYLNEVELQQNDDYEWCLHDPEVQKAYGGQIVVAHKKRILGAGANHRIAMQNARQDPNCPPRNQLAVVVVPPFMGDSGSW